MYLHQYQVIVVFLNIHISTLIGVHYFDLDMSCALGLAIFGVEIVEHWGSPSFMLGLQHFFEESKEMRNPYIQDFSVLLSASG